MVQCLNLFIFKVVFQNSNLWHKSIYIVKIDAIFVIRMSNEQNLQKEAGISP